MAVHWWISGVDTDWNTIGNWSATEGGASNGSVPTSGDDAYFSSTSSTADCIASAAIDPDTISTRTAETGGSDNWGGGGGTTLDLSTFNSVIGAGSGGVNLDGVDASNKVTFKMGTSGAAGLSCGDLHFRSTNTVRDFANGSILTITGAYSAPDADISVDNNSGTYIFDGDGSTFKDMDSPSASNRAHDLTITANARLNLLDDFSIHTTSGTNSSLAGIITTNGFDFSSGANGSGAYTIASTFDIQGAGTWAINIVEGASITNNSGTFSLFTGSVTFSLSSSNDRVSIPLDVPNAEYRIQGGSAGTLNFDMLAGTYKVNQFRLNYTTAGTTVNITNGGLTMEVGSGGIDFNMDSEVITLNWTATAGDTWKLVGTNAPVDIQGQDVGEFFSSVDIGTLTIIAGDTINIDDRDLTTTAISIAGTFKSIAPTGTGLTCAGFTVTSTGTLDMADGSAVTNSGNYTIDASASMANNNRGIYTATGSGNYTASAINVSWLQWTTNAGIIITATTVCYIGLLVNNFTNNGVMDSDVAFTGFIVAVTAAGSQTFGVNSDFTGTGGFINLLATGTTFTNNKVGAFGLTGHWIALTNVASVEAVAVDVSSATYMIWNLVATPATVAVRGGTLKATNFQVFNTVNGDVTIDDSTYDPFYEISGSVDFNAGSGTYTTTWSKGVNGWTFTGAGKTITAGPAQINLDAVTFNAGSSYTISGDFAWDGLVQNGTLTGATADTLVIQGDVSGSGSCTGDSPTKEVLYRDSNTHSGTLTDWTWNKLNPGPAQNPTGTRLIERAVGGAL